MRDFIELAISLFLPAVPYAPVQASSARPIARTEVLDPRLPKSDECICAVIIHKAVVLAGGRRWRVACS